MNPFELMELKRSSLTKKENEVYQVFLQNTDDILRETATSMAEKYNISQPAITRFCQKLGYQGFNDFKYDIYKHYKSTQLEQDATSIVDYYCKLIHLLPGAVSDQVFSGLAQRIVGARYIAVCGIHKSALPAQLLDINLGKFGILSSFAHQEHTHQMVQRLTREDVVIIFSAVGSSWRATADAIAELPDDRKPFVVLVTQSDKHPIRNKVNQVIWLPSYRNQGYSQYLESQVVPMIFADILTSYIANYIKEEKEP